MDDHRLLIFDLATKPFLPLPNQPSKINNLSVVAFPAFVALPAFVASAK